MKERLYRAYFVCWNCERPFICDFPDGVPISTFEIYCPHCDCKGVAGKHYLNSHAMISFARYQELRAQWTDFPEMEVVLDSDKV